MVAGKSFTVTRSILADKVVEEMGLPNSLASKLVGDLVDVMVDNLARHESIKVSGFASFNVYLKRPRKGMNLSTGERVDIDSQYVVKFKTSNSLKQAVHPE